MKIRSLLSATIVFLCLINCGTNKTEVSGEVFIATAGAGSYKLGLVQVSAVPQKEMDMFIESKRSDYEAAYEEAKNFLDNCEGLNCGHKWIEARERVVKVLFDPLPSAYESQATTDSDGRFKLTLKKPGKYALMASAIRATGSEIDEKYHWIVWVKADGKPTSVTLSNANTLPDSATYEYLSKLLLIR